MTGYGEVTGRWEKFVTYTLREANLDLLTPHDAVVEGTFI